MRNPAWLTVFAVLLVLFLISALFEVYRLSLVRSGPPTMQTYVREILFSIVSIVLAVGLFQHRKWAALIFSLATLALAMVLIVGSILMVPFPFMLLNFLFAIGCIFPTVVTIRCWQMLMWGRRR